MVEEAEQKSLLARGLLDGRFKPAMCAVRRPVMLCSRLVRPCCHLQLLSCFSAICHDSSRSDLQTAILNFKEK